MNKQLLLFTAILFISNSIVAQEKFKLEGKIGLSDFYINTIESESPDFMNYTEGVGDEIPENAHIGIKLTYAINDQWTSSLEADFFSMVTPVTGDLRITRTNNKTGWNLGLALIPFEIQSIEPFYANIVNNFDIQTSYYRGYTRLSTNNYFAGIYTGFNYNTEKKRNHLRYTINGGIAWNKKAERYLRFQKLRSNYIYADNYVIDSRPALWLKPELEYSYAIIDQPKYQIGIKLESQFFMTVKRLNYTVTHYEWTLDSGEINEKQLPAHWHHQLTVEAGLFLSIK